MSEKPLKIMQVFRSLVGGKASQPQDNAWIDGPEEPLTPREERLGRASKVLRYGAWVNSAASALLLLLVIFGGTSLHALLQPLLLFNLPVTPGTGMLLVILFIAANLSVLLLLSVGTLAQEFWTLLLAWALTALNIGGFALLGFTPAILTIIPAGLAGVIIGRDLGAFHANPVMMKELRGRMRGIRAFAIITIYLGLLSAFTVLLYLTQSSPLTASAGPIITGELGRTLFIGIVGIELLLIVFIVPALTAGAVTSERERMTYDLLQTTLLPSPSFVVGKMESALGYILLLLLAAVPLQSIAFLFGGVSSAELVLAFIILTVTAITLAAAGMFFSAQTERTLTATVRAYTLAMVVLFGVPFGAFILFQGAYGNALNSIAIAFNQSPLLEATVIYLDMIAASLNPITAMLFTQEMLIDHQQLGIIQVTLSSDGSTIPVVAPWILLSIIYLILSSTLILLSVRYLRRSTN